MLDRILRAKSWEKKQQNTILYLCFYSIKIESVFQLLALKEPQWSSPAHYKLELRQSGASLASVPWSASWTRCLTQCKHAWDKSVSCRPVSCCSAWNELKFSEFLDRTAVCVYSNFAQLAGRTSPESLVTQAHRLFQVSNNGAQSVSGVHLWQYSPRNMT